MRKASPKPNESLTENTNLPLIPSRQKRAEIVIGELDVAGVRASMGLLGDNVRPVRSIAVTITSKLLAAPILDVGGHVEHATITDMTRAATAVTMTIVSRIAPAITLIVGFTSLSTMPRNALASSSIRSEDVINRLRFDAVNNGPSGSQNRLDGSKSGLDGLRKKSKADGSEGLIEIR